MVGVIRRTTTSKCLLTLQVSAIKSSRLHNPQPVGQRVVRTKPTSSKPLSQRGHQHAHLVYRHAANNQLEMAVGGSSWTLTALGLGDALSLGFPTLMLDNDSLATGLIASNGSATNLEVWVHDELTLSKHTVANHSELTSELAWPSSRTVRCCGFGDYRWHAACL